MECMSDSYCIQGEKEEETVMKNTKICSKCGSNDIVRMDGHVGPGGAGNNVILGKTVFSAINVNRYICCNCGFVEEWIDKRDIEELKKSKKIKRL